MAFELLITSHKLQACLSQVPTGSSLFSDLITPTVAKIHTAKQEFSYEENVNTEEEDVDAVDCDRGSPIILATRPTEFYNLQSLQWSNMHKIQSTTTKEKDMNWY